MTDQTRLDEMLASLRNYVKELLRLGQTDRAEFLANPDAVGSAKYHFIVAIECCIDIANHVIASERLRAPTSYADAFVSLQEARFIQGETADASLLERRRRARP